LKEKLSLRHRLSRAWNIFKKKEVFEPTSDYVDVGRSWSHRPDRTYISTSNETSLVMPLYNKIAIDVSSMSLQHARVDQNGRYKESIKSNLQEVLSVEANIDQTGRAMMQDLVMSLIDEGCVALVPIETSLDPNKSNSFEIYNVRVGRIEQWFPEHVMVDVFNEKLGEHQPIPLPKKSVCIIENPHYAVMNEPNSILKRLITKLNLLDVADSKSASKKLDLIIQLPYIVKSNLRKQQAENRLASLEEQLATSDLGIGYIDGTEKITQLNRAVDNDLMTQITYLTTMLYNQLGFSEGVFNGTATEEEMLNYYTRTVEPILNAIVDEMNRKFLTKTARSQNQKILYFRDPFKLVPVSQLADIADKFTRNEIASSNDMRAIIGWMPSSDPKADELRNKNIPEAKQIPASDIKKEIKEEEKDVKEV